jgi:hypothetical protein
LRPPEANIPLAYHNQYHTARDRVRGNFVAVWLSKGGFIMRLWPRPAKIRKQSQLGEGMPYFLLYIDDKPIMVFETLEEAQNRARDFIEQGNAVRVESFIAPAPSKIWHFDKDVHAWVHQR